MPFTAQVFARKLRDLRQSLDDTIDVVAAATGIAAESLAALEAGGVTPSGDQVLIIADYFSRDFTWLIDDEAPDPDENATHLLRSEGGQLIPADRHAIAEFIHLCKSEALLEDLLELRTHIPQFSWASARRAGKIPTHKQQGIDCARAFRQWRGLQPNELIPDIFQWMRDAGVRVFRRELQSESAISGLFVRHPDAGRCVLINYSQDIYRQRFSAAHEVGHALMDDNKPFNVSRDADQDATSWIETRANSFASAFLMPPELLSRLATPEQWRRPDKIIDVADRLLVSIPALLSALRRDNVIDEATRTALREQRLRLPVKREPELTGDLSARDLERKQALLRLGLHRSYVLKGLEAHQRGLVSLAKLADIFLVDPSDVGELANLFGTSLHHD
jgi:Zn-dependent peptidase ImmA (M78 family)